jgi:two-component system response regulator AtoC
MVADIRTASAAEIPLSLPTRTPEIDLWIGQTPAMRQVARHIFAVARSERTGALIVGEAGTGKDLVAQAIHRHSRRASRPFIPINCGAIVSTLAESELFGSERGAFTDARSRRGAVELAHTGTLFLDEVGELSLPLQRVLLRFLETRQFRRLGSERSQTADARIIAATHHDLAAAVARNAFRADLFFRLNVFVIAVPPLRERKADLPDLINACLRERSQATRLGFEPSCAPETLDLLRAYDWPGNVRELRNVLERGLIFSQGGIILPEHLPPQIRRPQRQVPAAPSPGEIVASLRLPDAGVPLLDLVHQLEATLIQQAMQRTGDNQTRAAALLGLTRDQLRQRLRR